MTRRMIFPLLTLMVLLLPAAACGGSTPKNPEPVAVDTPNSVEQSVRQTVEAIAVAETVAALTGTDNKTSEPPAPTADVAPEQPTSTLEVIVAATEAPPVQPTSTTAAVTPTAEQVASCVTVTGVNMRSGPGTAYEPPVGTLAANTPVTPLSYVGNGFPQGEWLEIQVPATGQIVWVTAGPQFITCSLAPAALPAPAVIAPTPRATATPTPISATDVPTRVVAGLPPDVDNDVPGGECDRTEHIKARFEFNPNFLYRVYARDDREGPQDGDGIDLVRFTISDDFSPLYQREERTAGYCVFRGGEPDCQLWPFDEQGYYTWGEGGSVVDSGTYHVLIEVVSKQPDPSNDSTTCNWNFDMTVALP